MMEQEFLLQKLKQTRVFKSVFPHNYWQSSSRCHCRSGCRLRSHWSNFNVIQRKQQTCIEGFLFIRTAAGAAVTGRWRCTPTSVQGEASVCCLSASFTCRCWTRSDFPRIFTGSSCQLPKKKKKNPTDEPQGERILSLFILFRISKYVACMWVLRCWGKGLSAPSLASLTALHWSVVLFLNELRHHWRDRPLPICAHLLHVLQGFYWSTVHSHIHQHTKWSIGATLMKYMQKEEEEEEVYLLALQTWRDIMRARLDLFIFFSRPPSHREPQMLDQAASPRELNLMPDFFVSSQVCLMFVHVRATDCRLERDGVHACSCLSLESVMWKISFLLHCLNLQYMYRLHVRCLPSMWAVVSWGRTQHAQASSSFPCSSPPYSSIVFFFLNCRLLLRSTELLFEIDFRFLYCH